MEEPQIPLDPVAAETMRLVQETAKLLTAISGLRAEIGTMRELVRKNIAYARATVPPNVCNIFDSLHRTRENP